MAVRVDPARITTLAEGKLYALTNPYAIDGRLSWHPDSVRGYATMNCYLVVEGNEALLIDTGVTVDEAAVIEQLEHLLPEPATLRLFPLRLGEFNSICNMKPIMKRFSVDHVYGVHNDAALWIDFRPEWYEAAPPSIATTFVQRSDTIDVDRAGTRVLQARVPELRLLITHWIYDPQTRTLFTSDMFTHAVRATSTGPWIVSAETDDTNLATVREHLLGTRYWWLAGADTEPLIADLADVFDSYDVETIAPGYGCVLHGREVVKRHHALVERVLAEVGRADPYRSKAITDLGEAQ